MLCLSGFELYSRWVPLSKVVVMIKTNKASSENKMNWKTVFLQLKIKWY